MGSCSRLGECGLHVHLERGVVVDMTLCIDDSAVSVRGVFVDAQVGHQHDAVVVTLAKTTERHLHDSLGVERARTNRILLQRNAEQHDAPHPEVDQLSDFAFQ